MSAKRFIKGLLKFIAFCVVFFVVGSLAMLGYLSYSLHKLTRHSQRMHAGMSVREFVKVMPTDYFDAKVLRERRDIPCRGAKGEFVPPESDDPKPSLPAQEPSKAEVAKLAPCPAVTFAHFRHNAEGKLYLEVESFGGGKLVTADEFAEFIERDFHDSGFYVGFTYLTLTPQHQTFGAEFDRNGRLAQIVQPYGWD